MIAICSPLRAQMKMPVGWSYAIKKTNPSEAIIFIKATIEKDWHIYSAFQKDGGPTKTSFSFAQSEAYILIGSIIEPKPFTTFEVAFGIDVSSFEKQVIFQQKIKLKQGKATVKGKVKYMACNDHECLPEDEVEFSIPVQ